MVEQLAKASQLLKIPTLLRILMNVIGGIGLAFLLYYSNGFNPLLSLEGLGVFERDILFLVLAYLAGRILAIVGVITREVSVAIVKIVSYLLDWSQLTFSWQGLSSRLQLPDQRREFFYSFLTGKEDIKRKSAADLQNSVLITEIAEVVKEYPQIDNQAEESMERLAFIKIMLGATIVAAYLVSNFYIIASLLFLWLYRQETRTLNRINQSLYEVAVVKRAERKILLAE